MVSLFKSGAAMNSVRVQWGGYKLFLTLSNFKMHLPWWWMVFRRRPLKLLLDRRATSASIAAEIEGCGQQVHLPFPYRVVLQVTHKIQAAWNCLSSEPELTWCTVAIIIRVFHIFLIFVLWWRCSLSLSLSYIHYNHSFRTCTETRFPLDRFSWKCLFARLLFFFENSSRKWKFQQNLTLTTVLYMKTNLHFWSYLTEFFLEWEVFQINL